MLGACLRRGQEGDVRAHHPPPLGHADPGLALPPAPAGLRALELRVRGGQVAAEGGDHGAHEGASHVGPGAREPRGVDRLESVAVVSERVTDGAGVIPEARVEHVHVIGVERLLVALEGRAHLGHYLGQVDLHVTHLSVGGEGTMRAATTPSRSRRAATRKSVASRQGAATSCTPTGSGPGPATGTDMTGRPTKDRGWV